MLTMCHIDLQVQDKIMKWSFENEILEWHDYGDVEQSSSLNYQRSINADHAIIDSRFLSDCTGAGN